MSCYIIHICSFSKYVFFYWCLIVLELWFSFTGENFGNRRFLSFKKFQSSQVPIIVFYTYWVLNNVFLWFEIWHVPKAFDFFKYININNLQLQFIAYVVSLASKYGGSVVSNLPASAGNVSSILGQEDPLEKEMETFSCLGNPMNKGAWRATVYGVAIE